MTYAVYRQTEGSAVIRVDTFDKLDDAIDYLEDHCAECLEPWDDALAVANETLEPGCAVYWVEAVG